MGDWTMGGTQLQPLGTSNDGEKGFRQRWAAETAVAEQGMPISFHVSLQNNIFNVLVHRLAIDTSRTCTKYDIVYAIPSYYMIKNDNFFSRH